MVKTAKIVKRAKKLFKKHLKLHNNGNTKTGRKQCKQIKKIKEKTQYGNKIISEIKNKKTLE